MGECVECGDEVQNKDRNGWYRDKCCDCILSAAGAGDESRPIPGCECPECLEARV